MSAINNPTWDTLMHRAEAYGRYHQAEDPGMKNPLTGEFAGKDTLDIFAQNIGVSLKALDRDDIEVLVSACEDAYAEQESGRNFPRCVCPVWTHDLDVFELVARDARCPAHDGDAWTEHMNAHQH